MDWTEIKITVDTKDIDTAGDIANMVVPYGIYIEDYSDLEREAMEIAHILLTRICSPRTGRRALSTYISTRRITRRRLPLF